MTKKRTYFRVRRIAAAELLRLSEAGHPVNAEAVGWAEEALNGIDNIGGRSPLVDRGPILDCLGKRPLVGMTIDDVCSATGLEYKPCMRILYLLRKVGQIGMVKVGGRVLYFVTPAAAAEAKPDLLRAQQQVYEARRQSANAAKVLKKRKAKAVTLEPRGHASQAAYRAAKSFEQPPPAPQPGPEPAAQVTKSRLKAPPAPPVVTDHPNVKRTVIQVRRELIDRFGATDPTATIPGGFREEFQRLRAGGATS